MRVTLVTETFFPQVNGVSRTLGQLARHLREAGDHVQLVHPNYGEASHGPHDHLVRSWTLPFYKELHLPLPPFTRVLRAVDQFQPDLIHIATEATLGLRLLQHALSRRIPTVSSFHTNFDQYTHHYRVGWSKGLIWRYLRWFHNRTRETYVPSRTTIAELESRGFERLRLWPRGVDSTIFQPARPQREAVRNRLGFAPDDVVIGYVSRIAAEKNIDYLADALVLVAETRPNVRFLFVGDGPARSALEARMGEHARFVGYRSGEDLADHYAAADLFAFTSLTETFGNVVLEAMASGLPVVALRAGGVGETVAASDAGLLIDPSHSPQEFAQAVLSLVDDASLRHELALRARSYAESQSWGTIMSGLRERYSMIVGDSAARPSLEAALS